MTYSNNLYYIDELSDFKSFANVYKVYMMPPYCEKWTYKDIECEYKTIKEKGKLYGAFCNEKCIGILALRFDKQPIKFESNIKAVYLSDLAVLSDYRNSNLAFELVKFAIGYAREKRYNKIYLRTLEGDSSYEYHVFKDFGFTKIPDVVEIVNMPRTRKMDNEDCRFFWQYDIK